MKYILTENDRRYANDVSPANRQDFIDQHVFYDGRYIGTDLVGIQLLCC